MLVARDVEGTVLSLRDHGSTIGASEGKRSHEFDGTNATALQVMAMNETMQSVKPETSDEDWQGREKRKG